jgi:hypothetical protein
VLRQLRKFHGVFLRLAGPAIEGICDDEGFVYTGVVTVYVNNVGQRLGMVLAYGSPAKAAGPVGRSITMPTVHHPSRRRL